MTRPSLDSRDYTKEPPALLSPLSVLKMRAMIRDAVYNGDKVWPYGWMSNDWSKA